MAKDRIDKLVVERGLAESRARAQAMILAGQVLVADQRIDKPGQMVDRGSEIRIKGVTLPFVSRGGLKLEAALAQFKIDPLGSVCIDVGASTGGFTDCLLQRGAARVWAVDVGHNQLAWKIRQDPRVEVIEGLNARNLSPDQFPVRFDLGVIDVSFISLTRILPAVRGVLADSADCVALIKPQFEVGKGEVGRGGIVTDAAKHLRVLVAIKDAATASGLSAIDLIESPILGAEGNREFLIHLRPSAGGASPSSSVDEKIRALTTAKKI
jgi:23S rRNA (cytidine1920-2'-O)/16S rRNA (cytidine1409-2'-O)-methyltransferase